MTETTTTKGAETMTGMMNATASARDAIDIKSAAILAELVSGTRSLTGEIYRSERNRMVVDNGMVLAYVGDELAKTTPLPVDDAAKMLTIHKQAADYMARS